MTAVAAPPAAGGLIRTPDHFYRWNGGALVPGASKIIKALDVPELQWWRNNETAACAVRNFDFIAELIRRGGTDAAVAWLAKLPDYQRDAAAKIGSSVHAIAEQIIRGASVDILSDGERPFVDAYRRWLDTAKPAKPKVERMVYSEKGYGGTLDMVCELDGAVTLLDIKTGKGVYRETRMQLAAYGNADFVGQPDDPRKYPLPRIERYAVLHLRPEQYADGFRLIEYDITDADYDAFLACLRLTMWRANLNGKGT